jgi:hypothetical protein
MTRFRKGDWVRCLDVSEEGHNFAGHGFKEGLIFRVTDVSVFGREEAVYFGGHGGHGVFEKFLVRAHYNIFIFNDYYS